MATSGMEFGTERAVSYMPFSHIAAQITDIYCPIANATCVYFARPDALKVRYEYFDVNSELDDSIYILFILINIHN